MSSKRSALFAALRPSLESEFPAASEAATEVELEHTWYGQLTDRSQLENAASIEKQEQWSVPAKPEDCRYGGSIRVRKSTPVKIGDRSIQPSSFMMCLKAFEKGKLGCLENEFEINEATFQQFCRVADSGMIKTRYTFPIEGTDFAFEVDVYQETDWVKIDLEVNDPKFAIPDMPVALKGLIKDNPMKRTPEQEKLIESLMERYFRCKNQYPKEN